MYGKNSLFLQVDNSTLERFTKSEVSRRRTIPKEKKEKLLVMRMALQSLPPRELQILFSTFVQNLQQDHITDRFSVRQSNISYRQGRSFERIDLFCEIYQTLPETIIREILIEGGYPESKILIILGVVKTVSQTNTSEAYEINLPLVRKTFSDTLDDFQKCGSSPELVDLMGLVAMNYNRLKPMRIQNRWKNKIGNTNTLGLNTFEPSKDSGFI